MKTNKAILISGDVLVDISEMVQQVSANDKLTGEQVYSGCGLVIFRKNHRRGNAVVFLSFRHDDLIFGEEVDVYTVSQSWTADMYSEFNMKAQNDDLIVIDGRIKGLTEL